MQPPGEVMYSDAWMERVGQAVPLTYRNLCRNICKAYELGNDKDILMIWYEVAKELPNIWNKFMQDNEVPINAPRVEPQA